MGGVGLPLTRRAAAPRLARRLVAADVLGIVAAFAAAWLVYDAPLLFADATWEPFPLLAGGVAGWVAAAGAAGHYRDLPAGPRRPWSDLAAVAGLLAVGAWAICLASWVSGKPDPDVRQLVVFSAIALGAIVLARQVARRGGHGVAAPARRRRARLEPALALGDAVVLLAVLTACSRLVDEPLPADSRAWEWVFVTLGIPAWVVAATLLGHYARASLRAELVGALALASWGAWLLVAISPYTGETDPDVNQVFVVWIATIAAVVAVRRALRLADRLAP